VPTTDYKHVVRFNVSSNSGMYRYVCGTGTNGRSGNVRLTDSGIYAVYVGTSGAQNLLNSTVATTDGINTLEMNLNANAVSPIYLNGTRIDNNNAASTISSQSSLKLGDSHVGSDTGAIMKFYGSTITQNGTVIHDFVPVKRNSDNKCGLYDMVQDVFYSSATSTEFTCP